jgi:hypothetical protein
VLREWLQHQHALSNQALEQPQDLPSREEVVADIIALAPLTMIDGAWLAGFAHPALAASTFGSRLFETLYDELGNGIEAQNHPVIYRQLLRAVHGELPATAAPGYAAAECFADEDFELPVFWLAIAATRKPIARKSSGSIWPWSCPASAVGTDRPTRRWSPMAIRPCSSTCTTPSTTYRPGTAPGPPPASTPT